MNIKDFVPDQKRADEVRLMDLANIRQGLAVPLTVARVGHITSHDLVDLIIILTKKIDRFGEHMSKAVEEMTK